MKKIDRKMTALIKEIFNQRFLENIARKTKFVQRSGSLTSDSFISLCTFYKDSICKESLSELVTTLARDEQIHISPQALSERFNEHGVDFLKYILKEVLISQNRILENHNNTEKRIFNRISK